jgi:hypothetical protein
VPCRWAIVITKRGPGYAVRLGRRTQKEAQRATGETPVGENAAPMPPREKNLDTPTLVPQTGNGKGELEPHQDDVVYLSSAASASPQEPMLNVAHPEARSHAGLLLCVHFKT